MSKDLTSNNIVNDDLSPNTDERDYKELMNRLKEIKATIAFLEKTIFK